MTNHFILPSRLVKPILIHMFHRPSIDADIIFWIYGEDNGYREDINKYNAFSDILRQTSSEVPLMNINKCFTLKQPEIPSEYIGLSPLLSMAEEILDETVKKNTKSNDRVNIVADSQLWFAVGVAYQRIGILDHAPRIISKLSVKDSATIENLGFLNRQYSQNIRIDLIESCRCEDILCAARTVEAIQPPEEPNGVFLTTSPKSAYYISDKDLPTPITGESIRVIRQLRHSINEASVHKEFLKRTRTISHFSNSPIVRKFDSGLIFFEEYLNSISDRFRCDFIPKNISKQLAKVEKATEGLSANSYLFKALDYIISLSFEEIQSVAEGGNASQISLSKSHDNLSDFSQCIDPLIAINQTKEAFANISQELAPLRSLCLDVWQSLLEGDKGLSVEEFVYAPESDMWRCITGLPESETIISQKVIFRLTLLDKWTALTSPFTGFAVFSRKSDNEVVELKNRSVALKQFIYDYVMYVPGFSQEFIDYVTMSCQTDEISDNRPFFIKYPNLGLHIPVY